MKIDMDLSRPMPNRVVEGNVYAVRGGRGMSRGHMYVVIAITEDNTAVCLTVDPAGFIVGANQCAAYYFEDKMPIAFCEGLDTFQVTMRSI